MATYLSIDLDFWNQGKTSFPHMKRFLRDVKDRVPNKLLIVDSHEEILSHVNSSGCDHLINVDWHSDISNRFDPKHCQKEAYNKFNCGTWVTYVDFRDKGQFTWIHPYRATERGARGYCHYPHKPCHNPFLNPQVGGWNVCRQIKNKHPEQIIDWWDVQLASVTFSYDWVRHDKIWDIAADILGFRPSKNPNAKIN